jgi:hypothetical protein
VNTFGNKSLDIVEKQFPILSAPTDQIIQPFTNVKARIGFAVSQLKEKEQAVVNPRLEYVADQLECLLDQYLPSHQEQQDEKLVGAQRLYSLANTLSARMSQKVAQTTKTTEEEERQVKEMIRSWIMEQSSSISQQQWPVLKEQLRNRVVAPIQTMYQFTQFEMDRFKQEFTKPDLTHMDRARNILQLSQKDLFIPILQKCHIC